MARFNKRLIIPAVFLAVIIAAGVYSLVEKVRTRRMPLVAAGTLEAIEVDVSALVPGRLVSVRYDDGDKVKEGDVLATLDPEDLNAVAAAAEAAVKAAADRIGSARAALSAAEDNFGRVAAAYPGGGVTKAEYERALAGRDAARADYATASSLAAQARANLTRARVNQREIGVVAPLSGVVLSRNYEPGEVFTPGAPLMTLANLSSLELYVYLPENRIGYVNAGDPVVINVDSFPGAEFPGRVKAVASRATFTPRNIESREDRVTLMFKITVTVPNDDARLKPGMPADVVFVKTAGRVR